MFVGPFKILKRIGPFAYQLELPSELQGVHDVLHISNLHKCLVDLSLFVPLKDVEVTQNLKFMQEPLSIEDQKIMKLRKRQLALVLVKWKSRRGPEYTWELEATMRKKVSTSVHTAISRTRLKIR